MTPFYCIAFGISCLLVGSWIGRQWERAVRRKRDAQWSLVTLRAMEHFDASTVRESWTAPGRSLRSYQQEGALVKCSLERTPRGTL